MGIIIAVVCLGAGLHLTLFVATYRALAALPERVWKLAQAERTATEARALTALQEVAATKVGSLVLGLRAYHDQFETHLRAQVAEAEVRARVAERRSLDAGTALDAASTLVAELRGLVEDLPRLLARAAVQHAVEGTPTLPPKRDAGADPAPDHATIEGGHADDADEPEEERTHVAPRPLPGLCATGSSGQGGAS